MIPEARPQLLPNILRTSSVLMRPMFLFSLIKIRSCEGFNFYVILASTFIQPVRGNKVRNLIKNLKHSKAPSHDGVTNSMIKQLP